MPAPDASVTSSLPDLVLYLSLNCPYSALANYRVSWLQATRRAHVDVRLVCRPEDQVNREVVGDLRQQLSDDVDQVRGLLVEGPVFPIRVPSLLPDVQEATRRYAHHHGRRDRARARRVRLFRSLWLRGMDLSDHANLDAITGPHAPDHARRWQGAWQDLAHPTVPLLIAPDEVLRGQEALRELLSLRNRPPKPTVTMR